MQTSSFQLGLISVLSIGLGLSLPATDAIGYPAGPAVSLGTNPVFSSGGVFTSLDGTTNDIFTAPDDQMMVVTDLGFGFGGTSRSCDAELTVTITDSAGANLADYLLVRPEFGHSYASHSGQITTVGMNSGIPLSPGQTLRMQTTFLNRDCSTTAHQLRYTFSGYYAQP